MRQPTARCVNRTISPRPMTTANIRRVLQALNANRTPGWQFPGHYLGLAFDEVTDFRAAVGMEIGAHCVDSRGQVSIEAVGVLADVAMANAARTRSGPSARVATISARLSLAPLPTEGLLRATAEVQLRQGRAAIQLASTNLSIQADGIPFCTGEASFAVIDSNRITAPHPLPARSTLDITPPLDPSTLTPEESLVWHRALQADSRSADNGDFIGRFWGGPLKSCDGVAAMPIEGGLHIANRVGDIQGGVLLGLAGRLCTDILAPEWRLTDLAAQFIAPSPSAGIVMRAKALRIGRSVAFVECEVVDHTGRMTLRAQASFLKDSAA